MATRTVDSAPVLSTPLRYALALASVAAVVTLDRLAGSLMDDGSQFLLLASAVMASAWLGGAGPALLATVTGVLLAALDAPTVSPVAANMHLALFVVHALLVTAIVTALRNATRLAEYRAREAHAARAAGEAANRMKDEFLATISHELRTPLNAVLGWLHLIRSGRLDSPTTERGLESIERNVRHQAQLTGNLLDVSKSLTGRLRIESQPVSLAEIVRQTAQSARAASVAKRLEIVLTLPETPVVVLGDANRLRQIAWHLLGNAIKFTPSGGRIELQVTPAGHRALLSVRDNGPGIDPAFLPRVFDRFSQADPTPTRTAGGMGVGLSLVRELVELHGGEITAANGREGGAVLTASFPLQPADARADAPRTAVPGSVGPPLDGVRVLVFEREAEIREVIQAVLQHRGAIVRAVDSLAEALECLEAWRPDVLVSDGPGRDGDQYSLVGKVPALESARGGRIPALALTSLARRDPRVREMLADTYADLPKPVEPALLTAEIARLAGRERRQTFR